MIERELRPMQAVADAGTAVDRLVELYDDRGRRPAKCPGALPRRGAAAGRHRAARLPLPGAADQLSPDGPLPRVRRATAKLQAAGTYATTVTHPAFFRTYLTRQLEPLIADYGIAIEVGLSAQEIPYPYVLEAGLDAGGRAVDGADLATYFPVPLLSLVGDEIADGTFEQVAGEPLPLALFDGVRVDYSLRRLVHYTGCDWRDVQPWILLTNYHRYVDQFVRHGLERLASARRGSSGWSCRAESP